MTLPRTVGVVGGGRMGVGIAHAFLLAGAAEVVVVERDDQAAARARAGLERAVAASVERGSIPRTAPELLGRARVTTSVADVAAAGLVVEAVPEDLATKVDVLGRVEAVLPPTAWLATNTSSLSVDALAGHLDHAERFVGLHFFNPVPASALVEIVRGARTVPVLVEEAAAWVADLGKASIVVSDSPGFASSRLGVAIGLEAIRMVEEGVASPADIDTAMVRGYRFPVGPLRLTDLVGLDVRLGIAEHLERELGPRFAVPPLLREMVAAGRLGRKAGEGFFRWDE
ncbi:3-hydroxyacyl-CoA dehydrogenase family protein [Promicromonospora kroppenstedtii]|uniref:3-hydroxyacyl-CoA dehydrogenase family protein n=1 Tax=Promicromonospora kroppenstedtii TaxID=440482 RepID=UPI0004B4D3C6|nr:3-hydroxyacyl-CoA dehydrogenase family protein [Promicromonospora kroppenstedtii]